MITLNNGLQIKLNTSYVNEKGLFAAVLINKRVGNITFEVFVVLLKGEFGSSIIREAQSEQAILVMLAKELNQIKAV